MRASLVGIATTNMVGLWAVLLLVGSHAVADEPVYRIPPRPIPPANVSNDPTGVAPPEFSIPPGEVVGPLLEAEKVQAKAGEDFVDWSVKAVGAEAAWAKGITGKGVKVAVLDTGIDPDHRDLEVGFKGGKDFTNSRNGFRDSNSHGTHCAGSIGARKNGWGVQGVAYECDLYAGKVLGDNGSGSVAGIRDGILWAVNDVKADVISMSLGGGGTESYIPVGLKAAEDAGVIVVAAAGNDGNSRPVNYPAAYPFPIAISAVDVSLRLANFSCTGTKVEATGPGVNVRSALPGDKFGDYSGTSMATPNVSGVAALWVQADMAAGGEKKTRPGRFRAFMATTNKDLGVAGRDSSFGWGLPDASKIELKTNPNPPPPVTPPPVTPPAPGKGIQLDESDLNEKGQKKLKDGGMKGFKWESVPGDGAAPPPVTVPKMTSEEMEKKVLGGETVVAFVGVPPDPAAHPTGVVLVDPPADLEPGVYEFSRHTVVMYKKLK